MTDDMTAAGGVGVDVLAVMDAACCVLATDKTADPQRQLEQARAAVAELIEAASCGDSVGMAEGPDGMYFQPILAERLRAALSRARGG